MSILRSILLSSLAICFTAVSAKAWDMPTPYPDNNFHTINIKAFADDVRKRTDGEVDIKVHSAGSLFKHPEIKNAVRGGQVPIGEFLMSRLANEDAVYEVDSVPFLATNYDDAARLWAASREEVSTRLAEQGLLVLFAVPWPPQGLYTAKPVNSVDDLKGVKFRAYNTATERLAQLAGAVPTQVEVPDIPQAFTTGRVEAMITSPSTGANTKAWDFVTHFYHTQAWLPKNVIVVNARAFRQLPEETQTAILNAAELAEQRGWAASQAETEAKMKELRDNGMSVENPGPELQAGLKEIGGTMTEEWVSRAGEAGKRIVATYGR